MKVAVLCSAYNSEKFISKTIQSVLNQTYSNYIFYIGNDGSKDNTGDIIKSFCEKNAGKIIFKNFNKNRGSSAIMNDLLMELGDDIDIVTFIDGDDIYFSNNLEEKVKIFKNKNIDFLLNNLEFLFDGLKDREGDNIFDSHKSFIKKINNNVFINYLNLLEEGLCGGGLPISYSNITIRKIKIKEYKLFTVKNFNYCLGDLELLIHFYVQENFGILFKNLGYYRQHGNNVSKNMYFMKKNLFFFLYYLLTKKKIDKYSFLKFINIIKKL